MEYLNIVNQRYNEIVSDKVIFPKIKIELLDQYENAYLEIIEDVSSQSVGTISCQFQQGVRKTISLQLFDPEKKYLPNPNTQYFWIGKKIKVYVGVEDRIFNTGEILSIYKNNSFISTTEPIAKTDNLLKVSNYQTQDNDIYWFSKGIFIITSVSVTNSEGTLVSIEGVDKYGAFGNETGFGEMIGNFQLSQGQDFTQAIKEILKQNIGNGMILDPQDPIIDPYFQNRKIPITISKGPGSYLADLLNDLSMSFKADIYYDNEGRLNIWRSLNYDQYRNRSYQWNFKDNLSELLNFQISYEFLNVINYVCVTGDNPNTKALPQYIAKNENEFSPLAIQKIGIKSRYIESSSIQTQQEAKDYAEYLLKQYSLLGNTVTLNTTFLPHLDVDQVVTLTSEEYGFNASPFIVTSINIPLGIGTSSIVCSNIEELPEVS